MTFSSQQFCLINTEVVNQSIFNLFYVHIAYLAHLPFDQCVSETDKYNTVNHVSFHDSERHNLAIIVIILIFQF